MDQPEAVEQIGPEVAVRLLAQGAALIDVRELEEWRVGRAPEAVHVPLGELALRLNELPTDRKLIMVCRSGGRSGTAAAALSRRDCPPSTSPGGCRRGRPHRSRRRGRRRSREVA